MSGMQQARQLAVRLAADAADLAAVQRLRWEVFVEEMGAAPSIDAAPIDLAPVDLGRRECDPFDSLCDHLLVTDESPETGEPRVVGTYRLLRESVARAHGGFYSASEFELDRLVHHAAGMGELLELGRSCVLPGYRTSQTISLLWRGISQYLARHRIGAMFGCASFAGTDPAEHAASLSYLAHRHLAPAELRPRVLGGRGIPLEQLAPGGYDERRALLGLPPLIKGYLRAGALFGEGAFVDFAFGTIDVCVVLAVDQVSERYASRFNVAA